ncbi:MAG TPA: hypothetical protein VM934_15145 [Pyrinomonadaceae bacterium]|jgi:hypothetical protein|nr:hypothetical protein [Pyrinomonadaceae bacterium]
MTTHRKSLEELIHELPPEGRDKVRQFVEILLTGHESVPSYLSSATGEYSRLQQFFGAWDSGVENSADNDLIDDDLAREYGRSHEAES